MKIQGIHLSWIVVTDLQKAIKFYTEVVGLKVCEANPEFGWAELSGPEGARLGLAQANPHMEFKPGVNAITTITVDDIVKARQSLQSQNATLLGEIQEVPGHVKMQTFADSDGNTFQLCELLSPIDRTAVDS